MNFFKRKIRGLWNIIWLCRHYFGHFLVGLTYAWILREVWAQLSVKYIFWSLVGSTWIDLDHFLYAVSYGRHDWYGRQFRQFLKQGQIRQWIAFVSNKHKHLTGLMTHNIYFIVFFILFSVASFYFDWKLGVVLFGAKVLHLVFDLVEDLIVLGYLNENWKHWRKKSTTKPITS